MLMSCIDRRGARVRRGCAGDAGGIVKQPQRGTRASPVDPKGRIRKGLGTSSGATRDAAGIATRHPPSPSPCEYGAVYKHYSDSLLVS